jgi:hypothetical protein
VETRDKGSRLLILNYFHHWTFKPLISFLESPDCENKERNAEGERKISEIRRKGTRERLTEFLGNLHGGDFNGSAAKSSVPNKEGIVSIKDRSSVLHKIALAISLEHGDGKLLSGVFADKELRVAQGIRSQIARSLKQIKVRVLSIATKSPIEGLDDPAIKPLSGTFLNDSDLIPLRFVIDPS